MLVLGMASSGLSIGVKKCRGFGYGVLGLDLGDIPITVSLVPGLSSANLAFLCLSLPVLSLPILKILIGDRLRLLGRGPLGVLFLKHGRICCLISVGLLFPPDSVFCPC